MPRPNPPFIKGKIPQKSGLDGASNYRYERDIQWQSDLDLTIVTCTVIAFVFGVNDSLFQNRKASKGSLARHVAMYLTHTSFSLSLERVAATFGRDRSAISYAIKKIEDLRDNEEFDQLLEKAGEILGRIIDAAKYASAINQPKTTTKKTADREES